MMVEDALLGSFGAGLLDRCMIGLIQSRLR